MWRGAARSAYARDCQENAATPGVCLSAPRHPPTFFSFLFFLFFFCVSTQRADLPKAKGTRTHTEIKWKREGRHGARERERRGNLLYS